MNLDDDRDFNACSLLNLIDQLSKLKRYIWYIDVPRGIQQ